MKVILLDRDGVINQYPGDYKYVTSWEEFRFLPGVKRALKELSQNTVKIYVLSNQAGVNKGIFSQRDLDQLTENMLKEIKGSGGRIDGVFYCIHRDEDNCACRKPKTGLIKRAIDDLRKRWPTESGRVNCFFIGDTIRDIQTGKSAGCKTILVFSGKERMENKASWPIQPDYTAKDLSEAVEMILKF